MHVIFITFYFIINALDLHHAILLEQFLGLVDMSHASDEEIVFYACMAAAAARVWHSQHLHPRIPSVTVARSHAWDGGDDWLLSVPSFKN